MAEVNARESEIAPERGRSDGRHLLIVGLWVVVLTIIWTVAVYAVRIDSWFPEATVQAVDVDNLFKFMLAAGGGIFILVQALLIAFVLRYRSQNKDPEASYGTQLHGNTRVEIAWTVAPVVLLLILLYGSIRVWGEEHPARSASQLSLTVHGAQYAWTYDLPAYGIKGVSTVALPVGQPVFASEYSTDVIHSWWIPEFRMKEDDVPSFNSKGANEPLNFEEFTPSEIGTYRVICTEYCGSGHSSMYGKIQIMSAANWIQWLRQNHANPKSIPTVDQVAALIRQAQ